MSIMSARMTLPARPVLAICMLASLAWLGWDYLFGLNRLVMPSCWDDRLDGLVELEGQQNVWFQEALLDGGISLSAGKWHFFGGNGIRFDRDGYAYISRWDWYAQDSKDILMNMSGKIAEAVEEKHHHELLKREYYRRARATKTWRYDCEWMKAVTLEPSTRP
jgi:hypothetical protein